MFASRLRAERLAHVCTILIVDDHQDSREAMAEIVRSEGHTYHEASNGREALDWLLAQSELPCMILLDLRMPVMAGWDFMDALRQEPRLADIPMIVVSATVKPNMAKPVL